MSYPTRTAFAFTAALIVTAAQAPAQGAGLEPETKGSVTWVSGGIAEDELQEMRAVQGRYNLRLLFAVQGTGEYLADIPVRAVNAKGETVLDAVSRGPMLFAKMPAGTYKVTVSSEGRAQSRSIGVPASGAASQSFYWPSE